MPAYAAGVATQVRIAKEATYGVAPGAGTSRLVRRKGFDLSIQKETFQSEEIRPDYQIADLRHGLVSSKGTLSFELSPGSHSDLIASSLRKAFAAGVSSGALTTVTATVAAPHFVRASGSWLADGFKIGDVVRWTGWATTGVPNNSRNYIISALTATQMTVVDPGSATGTVAAKASGDSVTVAVYGKKSFIPATGHTDESWAMERYYPDITPVQSELYLGVKAAGLQCKFAAGSMSDASIPLMGAAYQNATAAYYSAPTAVSTTSVLAASNGGLLVAGGAIAYVRELSFGLDNGLSPIPVIGSNAIQGIVQGRIPVTGSIVAMFPDATLRDYFLNETEFSLVFLATTSSGLTADFIQFCMPRCKATSADKPDTTGVLTQTIGFQALLNGAGGTGQASEATSISIQDSLAA